MLKKFGKTSNNKQRYCCQNGACDRKTFIVGYDNKVWLSAIKEKIVDMAMNGSGIRDTSRVLSVSQGVVMATIKKGNSLSPINLSVLSPNDLAADSVDVVKVDEVEADEMWSFVQNKSNQRWLWHAISHETGEVLAYVIASHHDDVLLKLKQLLKPLGIEHYLTDGWGGYDRHIPARNLSIGKECTQKIERKHLPLRTRLKRLVRKTICFSKSENMHDIVLGLFINRYEFGLTT